MNYIVFEQSYLKGRVLSEEGGTGYTIQIAGLDTNTISIEVKDELMARAMYKIIERHILDSVKAFIDDLEDKMAEAQEQAKREINNHTSSASAHLGE